MSRCFPFPGGCRRPPINATASLAQLVRQYALHCRRRSHEELQYFVAQPSFEAAVEKASLMICDGKRFSHQRRRSQATLSAARDVLMRHIAELRCCQSFQELHETVDRLVADIPDLGELYSYDAALFIGAKLSLMPRRVYMHAGTRAGARALGLPRRDHAIELSRFPAELRHLAPYEIEDFLCMFKSRLYETMA